MDKDVLEVILRKSYRDSKIVRIIDMKVEAALPKGENYSSTILRITLKVVLGNGRIAKKSFIGKKENAGIAAEQLSNDLKLFSIEVSVFTKILREMDYLMEEFEDSEGPLWCQFIHYSPTDSTIIFEDLVASGFTTVKRTEMQDLEHAKLVMRGLGRFHAMAKVLEARGILSKDSYKPYPFLHDDEYIRNILFGGFRALIKGMKQGWGQEWSESADKLSQISFEEFATRVKECGNFADNTFKCLNHGDCWNNNIMFKHNWEGRPIEMRFVDFQITHYNSPCVDVIYFIYTSMQPSVRRKNRNNMIELYYRSLIDSLERFRYEGSRPSLQDIKLAIKQLSFFGLIFFTACTPCILTKKTDAMDLNLIMKTNGEDGYNISVYYEDGIIGKLDEELKSLLNSKIFSEN